MQDGFQLTLSRPVVSNGYTSKCSGAHWSNPLFLIFYIGALWGSGLSARVPECHKINNGGLDQHGAEHFSRLIFDTIKKGVGLKELIIVYAMQLVPIAIANPYPHPKRLSAQGRRKR